MFSLVEGDTGRLPTNENHLNFRWSDANILFSMTRKGNAASIHFSAEDKKAKRKIKQAINEFCKAVFDKCEWCNMVIGQAKKDSVVRIARKCGFELAGTNKNGVKIMMRLRDGIRR